MASIPPPSVPGQAFCVLIVEDDHEEVARLRKILADQNIAMHVATNGVEAVSMARTLKPDVVLLDVRLPVMDGFEVFRALRPDIEKTGMRVILLSGMADAGAMALAKDAGAWATLKKPIGDQKLRDKVFAALQRVDPSAQTGKIRFDSRP